MPAQLPTIIENAFLKPQHTGDGFFWGVRFSLPVPAAKDGFVVQQVLYSKWQKVIGISPAPSQTLENYWEAWPVKKGDSQSRDASTLAQNFAPMQDTLDAHLKAGEPIPPALGMRQHDFFADVNGGLGTEGNILIVATVGFYEEKLPRTFKRRAVTRAGDLLASWTKPSWWVDRGQFRMLKYTWMNVRGAKTVSLKTSKPNLLVQGLNQAPPADTDLREHAQPKSRSR
jgi:hypothetical protein